MKILVVDDDEVTRKLLKEVLEQEGFEILTAQSAEEALLVFEQSHPSIVLSDVRMGVQDGLTLLSRLKEKQEQSIVILMTAFGSMDGAIETIKRGGFDYISKPFKISELKSVVWKAVRQWESIFSSKENNVEKKDPVSDSSKKLIGKSPKLVEVYKSIARAAMTESQVLVTGESGTGKELVSRAIHENSSRRNAPFIAVNCGALAEGILESELFGHVKGSFTGATGEKQGLFSEANQGTLFLDEIGDISAALQVKLLRVLQEGEIKKVGSTQSVKINVRVIAATHRDLDLEVKQGRFREDLFYRLKVISIPIPSVRERREDLPELIDYFLSVYSYKNKKPISHVSDDAMVALKQYDWPGNVRELEHAIERAVAMASGEVLFLEDFPVEIRNPKTSQPNRLDATDPKSLEEVEKEHILKVLKETQYNKSKAAETLGIDRATLYRKASRYGIALGDK